MSQDHTRLPPTRGEGQGLTATAALSADELDVLDYLSTGGEELAFGFGALTGHNPLAVPAVRAACRSLAAKGLAQFMRGLMDEEGRVAGSGYAITRLGLHVYWNAPQPHPPGGNSHEG